MGKWAGGLLLAAMKPSVTTVARATSSNQTHHPHPPLTPSLPSSLSTGTGVASGGVWSDISLSSLVSLSLSLTDFSSLLRGLFSLSDFSLFPGVSLFHVISFFFPRCLSFLSAPGQVFSASSSHFHIYLSSLGSLGNNNRHALTGPFVHGLVEYAFTLLVSAAAFVQNLLNIVLPELD